MEQDRGNRREWLITIGIVDVTADENDGVQLPDVLIYRCNTVVERS